jgi:hypothetical protein
VLFELYRYAPGPAESIPKHAHEDYQFCLSLDWPGEYSYRGTYHAVPAGSLSVIHPGEMHAARDTKNRQTHATFRVMYTTPVLLQSIAAEVSGRHTSLPYFTDPMIVDQSLAHLFLKCHLATEASTCRRYRSSFDATRMRIPYTTLSGQNASGSSESANPSMSMRRRTSHSTIWPTSPV